ncbi:hypothetical protein TUZN_1886 [Thermoproteus uzoniensis 768-20]|uniref:Uncharacterized protein n=1 Tax=Thermoproteus uzoniensis (strain 768-20) TaxID=999630 RepID=F2L4B4_THEU7|nr:hypothetical protein TUZN_1886 [Thermoproteus uzoniensis 768-20]
MPADAVLGNVDALRKVVGEVVGVYDAPGWLIAEILGDLAGWEDVNEDVLRRAVELNSSKLHGLLRRNLQLYRPGRSSIRKAAPYLVAELLEAGGLRPAFVNLFGAVLPAAYRGHGLYTPVVPVVEAKRAVLNRLSALARYPGTYVVLSAVDGVPGLKMEIRKIQKPPYYYAVAEGLGRALERAGAMRARRDEAAERLYSFWRRYRSQGYLVLAGREVGGVVVDVLAVGLGKYGAVVGASRRKINRLSKFLDEVYEL